MLLEPFKNEKDKIANQLNDDNQGIMDMIMDDI